MYSGVALDRTEVLSRHTFRFYNRFPLRFGPAYPLRLSSARQRVQESGGGAEVFASSRKSLYHSQALH